MTAGARRLASDLGDGVVSSAVAGVLFCARGLAAHDGGELHTRHVARALTSSRSVPSHSGLVLTLLASPGDGDHAAAPWPPPPPRPVTVAGDVIEALQRADTWRRATGAACTTTVHLLLAVLDDPDVAAGWRRNGYPGAGAILQVAATAVPDPTGEQPDPTRGQPGLAPWPGLGDDATFAEALPAPGSWLDRLPLPPEPDRTELGRHTGGRRFAGITHVLDGQLPERGASGTAMSLRTVRRFAIAMSLRYAVSLATLVAGIKLGLDGHPWAFLQLSAAFVPLEVVPPVVWVLLGTLGTLTAPWPLSALVATALLAQASETRDALWMKRADIGDPGLSLARLRREVIRRSVEAAGLGDVLASSLGTGPEGDGDDDRR